MIDRIAESIEHVFGYMGLRFIQMILFISAVLVGVFLICLMILAIQYMITYAQYWGIPILFIFIMSVFYVHTSYKRKKANVEYN